MPSVAYPATYSALIATAETAVGNSVRVVDGYDISDDPGDVLMLGVPNLSDTSSISAGSFNQEQMGHGSAGTIRETGTINGIVMAWNGDGNPDLARTTCFGYLNSLNAAIRADRHIGVTDFDLVVGTALSSGDIAEDKVDGAACAVSFTVNYTALMGA